MSFPRALRVAATSAVLALAVGTATTTAADAKPTKPGGVTGLTAVASAHAGGGYDVTSSWTAAANATKYRVSLTKGGATLASGTVLAPATSWNVTVSTTPGSGSLTVQPVSGKQPGAKTTVSVNFPDITAPTGGFHATVDTNGVATLSITTPVSDDSGGAVTASIDWNDGSLPEAWSLASDATHDYGKTAARYVPTVTLSDASNNQAVVVVNAVVVADTQPPTGAFTVSPATAWSKLTAVTVTQTAIHDDWSPDANIARTVDWGDGTTSDWTTGTTISHVYQLTAGQTVTPQVTLTDEALNATDPAIATSAVTVNVDATRPVVSFLLPKAKHSVKAFSTLRGKATDVGTGVATVSVKAVEKRGTAWYGYNAKTKKWLKAATKTKAFGRARAAVVTTNSRHRWAATLSGLRKGTLVYKAFAKDLVANRSAWLTHQALLTRR